MKNNGILKPQIDGMTSSHSINDLPNFFEKLDAQRSVYSKKIPPLDRSKLLAENLFELLFPTAPGASARCFFERCRAELADLLLHIFPNENEKVVLLAQNFMENLPAVHEFLTSDAEAFVEFDPAATGIEEVISTYPGFFAVSIYRLSHNLHRLGVPLLPRIWSEFAHSRTGIDIHPAAKIGRHFFIDHGTGVVIGATSEIGEWVKIYQGVTLGAVQVDKSHAAQKRHPTIENEVTLYANCTILGGRTVVGRGSVIGGNVWLNESVPPFSVVLHQSQVRVRSRPTEELLNFVI